MQSAKEDFNGRKIRDMKLIRIPSRDSVLRSHLTTQTCKEESAREIVCQGEKQ